ncbi:MAG: nicotinate-nucleotide adenylyltransferase, partial [Planctomycetaceae bacterium]|nr:nicotinate-nucleotide adenylyltransferase [Planctomycetaceae bacterium]
AETCRATLHLDQVRLIPAGTPPHKTDASVSEGSHRAQMLRLAVSGYPEFVVDTRELHRSGPSYTVDTLRELREQFRDSKLFFLMGADSLRDFSTWRSPERITELATVVGVNRPGLPEVDSDQLAKWLPNGLAERVILLQMPGTNISASAIRRRVSQQHSIRFLTPKAVEAYIEHHRLYRS